MFEVPEVCAVHVVPSDEVSRVPEEPTAMNNPLEVVVELSPDDLHDEQQRGIKSISRDMMVPTLVKAIQEQQTLIERLQRKVLQRKQQRSWLQKKDLLKNAPLLRR